MNDTAKKMTVEETCNYLTDFHVKRLDELAELDVKKEYAAAIVILQHMVNDFTHLVIASHFQVAHEYFIEIEKCIEQSVDGDYPVFAKLEELKAFMVAAWNVGQRRRMRQMKPLMDQMVEEIRSSTHKGFNRSKH